MPRSLRLCFQIFRFDFINVHDLLLHFLLISSALLLLTQLMYFNSFSGVTENREATRIKPAGSCMPRPTQSIIIITL